ncbi:amidase [Paenibacillus sp. NPDC058071]|uniref:amidase n=1 Tax=Paenibacillus sp. NPDC058071 TaxID=3346326 RepID=UPI0036DDAE61
MEVQRMQDEYNAFRRRDIVLEPTGQGPLSALTFAVKDVFAIKSYTSGAGNPDWLRTHGPAEETASAIEKLLASGAKLCGTTHTDELMYSINGQNDHYGTPVNPRTPDRLPGGSSSGSAVAVAAGDVDFALGTDTGGSVRVPAAYCGIYGFRPTHDLVAIDGVVPLAPSFDTVGWMARDAALLYRVGRTLLGESEEETSEAAYGGGSAFRRMLIGEDAWDRADESVRRLLKPVLDSISAFGESKRLTVAPEGLEAWAAAFRTMQGLEVWETHGEWIESAQPVFGSSISGRFQFASGLSHDKSTPQAALWRSVRERMRELLAEDSVLVIPTVPGKAPLREISGEASERARINTMQLCCIAGLSGLPQVTVPAGELEGAPIGLSFIAGPGQDLKLLAWVREWTEAYWGQGGARG